MRSGSAGSAFGAWALTFRRPFFGGHRRESRKRVLGRDRLTFQQGSLEALPFGDRRFDLVHCRGVLMHIPDWQAALRELCRVIKLTTAR